MPVKGRKPKPQHLRRNRVAPTHEWTEIPDTPFAGGPSLPRASVHFGTGAIPTPARPLASPGSDYWRSTWTRTSPEDTSVDLVLSVAEKLDERQALRARVLTNNDWHERAALRQLDAQVTAGIVDVDSTVKQHRPRWPPETRRWWKTVSTMPHCTLWAASDWQFAIDTALIAASFHAGNLKLAAELRARERILGTTADARRDLRIRYVDPDTGTPTEAEDASVVAMATYRQMLDPP